MAEEYNLEDALLLPNKLFDKLIDGYHIIVAPQNPNWIVLNEDEYKMFQWLREGSSIRTALESYYTEYCQDEKECLRIMTRILEQIHDVDFSAEAIIKPEESVETITKKVHIGTTNGCNMRCLHCYMAAGILPLEKVDLQKTARLVSELRKMYGKLEIVVSGGEPLTYKYIDSLLQTIKDNHVILFTNGSLISESNVDLISECCDEIQISFEGVSKEYYSLVRGEQNYEKTLHAIELLKDRGKRIVLAVTMLPDTLADIRDNLISFIKALNYNNLEVRLSDEIEMAGNALSMNRSGFDEKESRDIVISLVRELEEMGYVVQSSDIRNTRFTNCGIGTNVLINYDGKIYPCYKLSSYSFDIDTDSKKIINEFNNINIETSNNNIVKCHDCELRYICSGGCRIDNYIKTGSMTQVICDDKYKDGQYRRLLDDFRMYREDV